MAVCVLGLTLGLKPFTVVGEDSPSSALAGASTKTPQHPTHNLTQVEHEHITLTAETFDTDETITIFGFDPVRQGVQPVLIQIDNRSPQTYRFQKSEVGGYVPASHMTPTAASIVSTARDTAWETVQTPVNAVGWVVKSMLRARIQDYRKITGHGLERPRDMRVDLVRMEIADRVIEPSGSLAGYVFIRLPQTGSPIQIKLSNVQTQAPLVFEIRVEPKTP